MAITYILEINMRAAKWGNSIAFRVPKEVVEAAGIRPGDDFDIIPMGRNVIELRRKMTREEALDHLKSFRGLLPADYKFDREEANAR